MVVHGCVIVVHVCMVVVHEYVAVVNACVVAVPSIIYRCDGYTMSCMCGFCTLCVVVVHKYVVVWLYMHDIDVVVVYTSVVSAQNMCWLYIYVVIVHI